MITEPPKYKLRDDLVIRRRVFADEVKYMVKDPLRLEYCTIDEMSYTLLCLCDGKRDLKELSEAAMKFFPNVGLTPLALLGFYDNYRKFNFFEDKWKRNILMIERQRTNRMRALKKAVANPLEITLPAWNPDKFFGRIVEPLGFLFTGKALAVYAVLIVAAIIITIVKASEFALPIHELWVIQGKTFVGIVVLWMILLFTVVLHEVGHGLTCKKFGGGVYKIGFLFLYFNPCMYCDVTEAYFFEDKRKKHAVTIAGGIVDLLTAAIATFVWFFTSPDLFLNEVAHRVALFNGVSGILVNFNPLMKYDGYYLLSDELEIPNLRGDSFRFIGNRFRSLFGLPYEEELLTRKQRKIFWIYGILGILYAIFVLWFVLVFVGGWLVAKLRAVGYLITLGLLLMMTKKYIFGLGGFLRFLALDKAAHFRRYRIPYLAGLAAMLAIFFFMPVPRHVRGPVTLTPGEEVVIRATEPGVIDAVNAFEGDLVHAGSTPVVVRAERVRLARIAAETALATAELGRSAAQAARNPALVARETARTREGMAIDRYYRARENKVTPSAPIDGILLTPHLDQRVGLLCDPGDTLYVLGDLTTLRAEVSVDELYLGYLTTGGKVEIRVHGMPGRVISGEVEMIAPVPSGGRHRRLYRVIVRVPNEGGWLRPGMAGMARFEAGSAPPFIHLSEKFARLFRIEFWI